MRIHLLSVGTRMPRWVTEGYDEYAQRMPPECVLQLTEIPAGRRAKGLDPQRAITEEGARLLKAIPNGARVMALDVTGRLWSTEEWATELQHQLGMGCDLALLVGGPEGLAPLCRERADTLWSLSRLTFPHPLVRIIVAEQIYRAWSLLRGHPYHRA